MKREDEDYPGTTSPGSESDYWYEPVDRKFLDGVENRLCFRIWSIQHVAARIEADLQSNFSQRTKELHGEGRALGYLLISILAALLLILWRVW
jgi:hypothetical protein